MNSILRRFWGYLHLNDVGIIEMIFSFAIMLSGFALWSFPLSLGVWILLIAIIFVKGKTNKMHFFHPLLLMFIYWVIHTAFLLFVDDVNIFGTIEQLLFFLSIFTIYPNISLTKLKGSLNWVAIISIAGLLYQWGMLSSGVLVHQLEIPGLTLSIETLDKISLRPSSFYQEPAAYTAFMMCPLTLSLMDRKYPWAIVMILSVFLTTSTTGIFVCFIMLFVSLINQRRISKKTVIMVGMIMVISYFSLTRFEVFEYGINKIEDTDAETNVRLSQGPYVVSTMKSGEFIFGAPYSSPFRYCKAGRAPFVRYFGESVFMSTFWQLILLYGVVGLCFYLNIYYKLFKKSRDTWPLLVCLCVVLFSSGYMLGVFYTFTTIVLLALSKNQTSIPSNIKHT